MITTQQQTRCEAILERVTDTYGDHYERMDSDEKGYLALALSFAVVGMAEGYSPSESWSDALDTYGQHMPDGFDFEELGEVALRQMINSQHTAVFKQLQALQPACR